MSQELGLTQALQLLMLEFDGVPITKVTYKGRDALIASELGRLLGYAHEGTRLVNLIDGNWSAEFIHEKDCEKLKGRELRDFKALSTSEVLSPNTGSLLLLYGSGVALVLQKSEKPAGIRLRRFLADHWQDWGKLGIYQKLSREEVLDMFIPLNMRSLPSGGLVPLWWFQQVARLNGWEIPMGSQHTQAHGPFFQQVCYALLPSIVRERIDLDNPPRDDGRRNHKIYQYLHEEVEARVVTDRLITASGIISTILTLSGDKPPRQRREMFWRSLSQNDERLGIPITVTMKLGEEFESILQLDLFRDQMELS